MMNFDLLREELDSYYSTYDNGEQKLLPKLEKLIESCADASSYVKKTEMIEFLCRECDIHLFRHTPLFFEISSGRGRHTWGGLQSRVGTYLHDLNADKWLVPYGDELKKDREEGFWAGWNNPVGIDHHCPGYDNLLKYGLNGIIRDMENALENCDDTRKREYYTCVIRANRALISLAQRFSDEAKRLASFAKTDEERAHYDKIAKASAHIPAEPPRTFYEALAFTMFYRECVGSVEGLGISILGHFDRTLYPYFKADIEEGCITYEEAHDLICELLVYTAVRFENDKSFFETSTTIELGGCDADGNIIYNELTDMILQAAMDVRSINTKLNCRISKQHPTEYLQKIAEVQLSNLPCVMMHNDDVLIPSRVRCGQDIEDARLYAGGGCHEIVLMNTEVCTRADTWISLPRIFLETLRNNQNITSFDELYSAFISDVRAYHERIVKVKNEGESHWCEFNPLPLYSSSFTGNADKGIDVTEGGAKYNSTALSMLGTATVIDSIYAVKQLVFDEKKLDIANYVRILDENYEKDEVLRQYIIRKIPKYGTNDETVNKFAAKLMEDLSTVSGQTNARGGKYLPAFYPHDLYNDMGRRIGATPDGRTAHTPLSRGASPSEFIDTDSPLDVIHSLKDIDFTRFADSFITEITLPNMDAGNKNILVSIIRAFLDAEGSSLQFNLISRDMLIEAKKNPEQHKNLLVRVCGYSSVFVFLKETTQEEIIMRAVR